MTQGFLTHHLPLADSQVFLVNLPRRKSKLRCHPRSNTILADPLQRTLGKEAKIKDTFLMFNLLAKQLFTM